MGHTALMIAERRQTWVWIGAGALLSVLMRLRMFWSPVSVDEGGFLAIARGWAHGQVLYRDVWVDRPQGLLVLFRAWDWLSGGSTASIRIMAMLFGVVLVVSTALVVREVAGSNAARWAAIICGVVSATPVLEGHSANGELISGAVAAAGIVVAVHAGGRHRPLLWFFSAGLLGGLALSLKQSGFDGLTAILGWLVLRAALCRSERRRALKSGVAMLAGLGVVIAILMLHAALTGWARWWSAVAGYRLKTQRAFSGSDWANLLDTGRFAVVTLGTTAIAALVGAFIVVRPLRSHVRARMLPASVVLVLWVLTATGAFLVGGGFWRHYWLLLAAPLSALAGVALSHAGRFKAIAVTALLVPCLAISGWVFVGSNATLSVRAAADRRSPLDEQVARWFKAHRKPGENLYVLCASAAAYAYAHQDPGYPYLWFIEVRDAPNAQNMLVSYLGDPRLAPRYIAQYQRASACDPSGRVDAILRQSYKRVTSIGYVVVYERTP